MQDEPIGYSCHIWHIMISTLPSSFHMMWSAKCKLAGILCTTTNGVSNVSPQPMRACVRVDTEFAWPRSSAPLHGQSHSPGQGYWKETETKDSTTHASRRKSDAGGWWLDGDVLSGVAAALARLDPRDGLGCDVSCVCTAVGPQTTMNGDTAWIYSVSHDTLRQSKSTAWILSTLVYIMRQRPLYRLGSPRAWLERQRTRTLVRLSCRRRTWLICVVSAGWFSPFFLD